MRAGAISTVWSQAGDRREGTQDVSESRRRLNELKREIALDRYEVDAGAVADAILTKLLLVRRASAGACRERS